MNVAEIMTEVRSSISEADGWCTVEKAEALAAIVLSLRPERVVEIGIWRGASAIPMLIALRELPAGRLLAVDPWSNLASIENEIPENAAWWGVVSHDAALERFLERMKLHRCGDRCDIVRAKSDDATPPDGIGVLHIDGSHTEQAVRDVARWAPRVIVGGFLVLDDLDWSGGAVRRAELGAQDLGFVRLYPLGTGAVYQRRSWGKP